MSIFFLDFIHLKMFMDDGHLFKDLPSVHCDKRVFPGRIILCLFLGLPGVIAYKAVDDSNVYIPFFFRQYAVFVFFISRHYFSPVIVQK